MYKALELAESGRGHVNPNPMVGAVIVKEGKIIGFGAHEQYGGPHAEINALEHSTEDVAGSTLYVTLEPCSHFGKTPPCVDKIIEKGIKKVIIAMEDPNPLVSGRGIGKLKEKGIEVVSGVLRKESERLNEIFIKYITTGLPFCILKTAMSLDGKIAAYTGDSKWITNELSREYVHQLRHQSSAVMVGIETVLKDDPFLTVRLDKKNTKNPVRVIVDTKGRIPADSKVLNCDETTKTIVATTKLAPDEKIKVIEDKGAIILFTPIKNNQVDLSFLIRALGKRKIDSVLIEGGSTLNAGMLKEGLIDKIIAFIAPKIIGGIDAPTPVGGEGFPRIKDCIMLDRMEILRFKEDLMIEAYTGKSD